MKVSIHDTEAAYLAIDPDILAADKADRVARGVMVYGDAYDITTTSASSHKEMLSGKWSAPVNDAYDYTGITIEEYDPANYAVPEGI